MNHEDYRRGQFESGLTLCANYPGMDPRSKPIMPSDKTAQTIAAVAVALRRM
jgi:hypothetical protein